jgi:hypothetical protein
VDVDRHRVDLPVHGQVVDQTLREDVGQTPLLVLGAEVLDLPGEVGQLVAGVDLKRVR